MDRKPDSLTTIQSRAALRRWCILAGLALAPLPAFHAFPEAFLYYLLESPPRGWTRISFFDSQIFASLGLPLVLFFRVWALPNADRPGLPKRSIRLLCFLVAYNPLRYFFERYLYGEMIAKAVVVFDQGSAAGWTVRHIDTPMLVGLAVAALLWRDTLQSIGSILFIWSLFVCVLWALGPPMLDLVFYMFPVEPCTIICHTGFSRYSVSNS